MTDAARAPHARPLLECSHDSGQYYDCVEGEKKREALAFPRLFIGKRSGNNNNYGRRFFRLPLKELLFLPSLPKLLLINEPPFLFLLGNNGHLTTTLLHFGWWGKPIT